jgi:hypothetical protein
VKYRVFLARSSGHAVFIAPLVFAHHEDSDRLAVASKLILLAEETDSRTSQGWGHSRQRRASGPKSTASDGASPAGVAANGDYIRRCPLRAASVPPRAFKSQVKSRSEPP